MEEHTLTKIEIITRPSKLEELKEALEVSAELIRREIGGIV